MKSTRLIAALLLLFTAMHAHAQTPPDDQAQKPQQRLKKWAAANPVEKVYLHFDKPFYAASETIWFKAYVTSGDTHRLTTLSNVLHVELLDESGKILQAEKLPVFSGQTNGDFDLPDSLPAGNYHVRAYTNYMRNAGGDYFFDKLIPIAGTVKNKQVSHAITAASQIDVQFFPEGGTLVNDIRTRVAFKAVAEDGRSVDIKGVIKDDKGMEVARLSGSHFGMGSFFFTPESGHSYKANFTMPDGSQKTVDFPTASAGGYALRADVDGDNIAVTINISPDLINASGGELSLLAQQNGHAYYSVKAKPDKPVLFTKFPKTDFPSGIVQITLFSPTGQPLCERLIFIQNNDRLKLTAITDKSAYTPREKVNLNLHTANAAGMPMVGGLSVAVVDEGLVPANESDETTILSYLLLTSDLKGWIEKPNYYFINPDAQTQANLDVLMLTQGYRRFVWKKLLSEEPVPPVFRPEKSVIISGTVKTGGGKPIAQARVGLVLTTSRFIAKDTLTDDKGRFVFEDLAFRDTARFIIQASKPDGSRDNVEIELDKTVPPGVNIIPGQLAPTVPDDYFENSRKAYLELQKFNPRVTMLKEVEIKQYRKKLPPDIKSSTNLNGAGNADQIITAEQLESCIRLTDCLSGRLAGVLFKQDTPYLARVINVRFDGTMPRMLVIIDGMEMDPDFTLDQIPAGDVATIESLRSPEYTSVYGMKGGGGVLVIISKRGGSNKVTRAPGILSYTGQGYYLAREFYAPRYDNAEVNASRADLRSTVFWKPDIITGKDGNATLDFFNADRKGIYRVVVEGIDGTGAIGRTVYRYKVE